DADVDDEEYDDEDDFDDDEEYDDEDDFDDDEEYDDEDVFDDEGYDDEYVFDDEEYDDEDVFDDGEEYNDEDDFDDDEEYDDDDDFDDDEEYDDEDDFDDDEEYDDDDDFDDDEEYDDDDDFDDDEEYDDDDEADEEDDTFEEPAEKRSFLPFKFRNPFRKSDDDDDDDEEDDYEDDADDDFDDEDDDLPEGAKSEDTFFKEDLADDEDDADDDQPKKSGLFGGLSLKNPFARKTDEEAEDEDEEDETEDDDLDEEPVKAPVRPVARPTGGTPRQPVRRPAPARAKADDEFYDDEFSNEYDDDDEEITAGGGRIDYGRIALILTFVILAIFAFDFCRRLWNDWRSQKGMLEIPSQSSAMVESMNGAESLNGGDTPAVTTADGTQDGLETETTAPLETEVTSTSGSKTVVDNRTTQTISVSSNDMHSGSLMLIDALHQQTAAPALVTLGDTGVANVATVVAPTYHIDSEAGAQLNKWLTDFNTATGLGKQIWIYGAVEVGQTAPYSQQINERTTGLTVDFGISAPAGSGILFNPYTADGNYAWLNEHAAEYGFVLRYPADKAEQTSANGLSWHYRYVGVPHAAYMAENNLCLEEYLEMLEDHTYEKEHLSVKVGTNEYEMYYVPTAPTGTETEIKYPVSAGGFTPLISGDNKGGFVVACVKE
ncbi:MAG: D-alanyl-D-alanine carboxypeptidase family protein, partial [Oscillospiraceae bacterium]|nr:D-alanyl-D-alanine carboxypeptidase family protein [Oscillospiraceae bacterium]